MILHSADPVVINSQFLNKVINPGVSKKDSKAKKYSKEKAKLCSYSKARRIIGIIVVAGLAVLIFWLAVRPAPVDYTVDGARVRGFNITSGGALNATFDLTLRADNRRNRQVALYYDSFEVAVWYGDQMLAFTEAAPFFQPRRNETRIEAAPAARSAPLLPGVARDMKHDRSGGVLGVEVRVRARIRFKVGMVKTQHYMLRVYCPQLIIK